MSGSSTGIVGEISSTLPSLLDASGEVAVLVGIEQDLRLTIEPSLSDPEARHTLGMIRRIMLEMIARTIERPVTQPLVRSSQLKALQDVIALTLPLGVKGEELAERILAALALRDSEADVSDLLGDAFGLLADIAVTANPGFSSKLKAILSDLLAAEKEVAVLHRARSDNIAAQQKPTTSDPGIITQERIEAFLREQMPDVKGLRVKGISRPPMGWGKVTLMVELDGEGLPYPSVVIRQDAALSGTDSRVEDEYPILKFVSDHGLPVPKPLFFSDDGRFGRPFMVMPRLSGAVGGGLGGPNPECTREALFDLARFAAKLHTLDPRYSDLPARWRQTPDKDANRRAVAEVHRRLVDNQVAPLPLARGTLLWLEQNAPPALDRPIIVHSDLGLWNLLVDGPKVNAVLDWELAHIGDPMQDLAYIRPLLGDRMTWQEFVGAYANAGGQEYRPDAIEFFGILGDIRNVMFTEIMQRMAVSAIADVRTSHVVITCLKMLEQQAAGRLLASA